LGKDEKLVALTFDDGPHQQLTPRLLDVLKAKNAKATFYVMGVKAGLHPDILARAVSEGHDVANHVWDHPVLTKISREEVHEQIDSTSKAIAKATHITPVSMRPPYGNTNARLNDFISSTENMAVVMWSLDTLDWKHPSPQELISKAMKRVKAGDVLLCHDIHAGTIEAIPGLIDQLQAAGYTLVPVSLLLNKAAAFLDAAAAASTTTTTTNGASSATTTTKRQLRGVDS